MTRIIITGVAGFIGSNLARKLLDENHQVIGLDNFSYGNRGNIVTLFSNPHFEFYESDLAKEESLKHLKADIIVHLASQKIPRYSTAFRTLRENALMLDRVLAYCLENKVRLVFASTSDIYGKNPKIPYAEDSDSVLGPTTVKRWSYALSKLYAEQLIIANSQEFGLEYSIMRFFGSYGPNQNTTWWGGPQAVFIQNILEGKNLEIHGDGNQTRTFTYVDDTVQGIMKCIFDSNARNEIFNIANEGDEEISIRDLARLILKLMDDGIQAPVSKLVTVPYKTFGNYEDPVRRVPDISKIKNRLGYRPQYRLDAGLRATIDWQRKVFLEKISQAPS